MAMHSPITAPIASATPIIEAELLDRLVALAVTAERIDALAEAVTLQLDDMQRVAREMGATTFTEQTWRVSSPLLDLLRDLARSVGTTAEALDMARMARPAIAG